MMAHDLTRTQLNNMKLRLGSTINERQDYKQKLDHAEMEIKKLQNIIVEKDEIYEKTFTEKESLHLKLMAKNDMYDHFEKKSQEYIKRIRGETKSMKSQMNFRAERFQMEYEDLYTK